MLESRKQRIKKLKDEIEEIRNNKSLEKSRRERLIKRNLQLIEYLEKNKTSESAIKMLKTLNQNPSSTTVLSGGKKKTRRRKKSKRKRKSRRARR